MTRFAALFCLFFVTACASTQQSTPPGPSASEGYLVASIEELEPVDAVGLPNVLNTLLPLSGAYVLKIRDAKGADAGAFAYTHRTLDPDANDLKPLRRFGAVNVLKLAPGSYEIYNANVSWRDGKKIVGTSEALLLPFTVTAGETIYLGSFGAVGFKQKNEWGFSVPAGAHFQLGDKSARDIEIAKKKMPELGPVKVQLPQIAAATASPAP